MKFERRYTIYGNFIEIVTSTEHRKLTLERYPLPSTASCLANPPLTFEP